MKRITPTVLILLLLATAALFPQAGTPDPTFNLFQNYFDYFFESFLILNDGKIIYRDSLDRIVRINPDGSLDLYDNFEGVISGIVRAYCLQNDGKILIGGSFYIAGQNNITIYPTENLIRLNEDLTIDTTFNPSGLGPTSTVVTIALDQNGNILVGGYFEGYNNQPCNANLIRLFPNGTLDNSFNSGGSGFDALGRIHYVNSIFVLNDGRLLVGGAFDYYNSKLGVGLIRLNQDGSKDESWNPGDVGFNVSNDNLIACAYVNKVIADNSGKIYVAGDFFGYNSQSCPNDLIRLNSDGTVDTSFNHGRSGWSGWEFKAMALQSDGKIIVGGPTENNGNTYNGLTTPDGIIRVNTDGTYDYSWNPGGYLRSYQSVNCIHVQQDQKVMIGGDLHHYNEIPTNSLCRLLGGTSPSATLSGTVLLHGTTPLAGVRMLGLPGTVTTNSLGQYSGTVYIGQNLTVTPELVGYVFTPANRPYTGIAGDMPNQDFTAALVPTYTISGRVALADDTGIANVAMTGFPGTVTTNAAGEYSTTVNEGWSGTVTPTRIGYSFTPTSNTYTNVTADEVDDYVGAPRMVPVHFQAGANGTLSGTQDQQVPYSGNSSPVTAMPQVGYRLLNWTSPSGFSSTDNPLTLTNVTAETTVTANFTSGGGTIDPTQPPGPYQPPHATGPVQGFRIVNPENGSRVHGVIMIGVEMIGGDEWSTAEFYIDGNRRGGTRGQPLTAQPLREAPMMEWDTRLEACGWHRIRFVGYREDGAVFTDEVNTFVNNVEFGLKVERRIDQALILRREYGDLTFSASNWGNLTVNRYRIMRRENGGVYAVIKEVGPAELVNYNYKYLDRWLQTGRSYTYKIEALDDRGIAVGTSSEVSI